jgi:hypothetical protein
MPSGFVEWAIVLQPGDFQYHSDIHRYGSQEQARHLHPGQKHALPIRAIRALNKARE